MSWHVLAILSFLYTLLVDTAKGTTMLASKSEASRRIMLLAFLFLFLRGFCAENEGMRTKATLTIWPEENNGPWHDVRDGRPWADTFLPAVMSKLRERNNQERGQLVPPFYPTRSVFRMEWFWIHAVTFKLNLSNKMGLAICKLQKKKNSRFQRRRLPLPCHRPIPRTGVTNSPFRPTQAASSTKLPPRSFLKNPFPGIDDPLPLDPINLVVPRCAYSSGKSTDADSIFGELTFSKYTGKISNKNILSRNILCHPPPSFSLS